MINLVWHTITSTTHYICERSKLVQGLHISLFTKQFVYSVKLICESTSRLLIGHLHNNTHNHHFTFGSISLWLTDLEESAQKNCGNWENWWLLGKEDYLIKYRKRYLATCRYPAKTLLPNLSFCDVLSFFSSLAYLNSRAGMEIVWLEN